MRIRTLLSAVVAGALALGAAPARADSPTRDYLGGCAHETYSGSGIPEYQYHYGVIYVAAVVYSGTDPEQNPVSATVTCTLYVNGVVADVLTASGTGVVVAVEDTEFVLTDPYEVVMCERVDYDNGEFDESCDPPPSPITIPPDPVADAVTALFVEHVDPLVCPVFAALDAADVPGVLEVNEQGDVFLLGEPFWDCPPYDLFPLS